MNRSLRFAFALTATVASASAFAAPRPAPRAINGSSGSAASFAAKKLNVSLSDVSASRYMSNVTQLQNVFVAKVNDGTEKGTQLSLLAEAGGKFHAFKATEAGATKAAESFLNGTTVKVTKDSPLSNVYTAEITKGTWSWPGGGDDGPGSKFTVTPVVKNQGNGGNYDIQPY